MQRRVVVSLARLFRDAVPGALPRGRLNDALPRLRAIGPRLRGARLPPEPLPDAAAIGEAAAWLRDSASVVDVAGQPGAILATRIWLDAFAPGALVRTFAGPDADLQDGGRGTALVAMLGPDWVDDAVEAASSAGRRVLLVAPPHDGPPIPPPPGGRWLDDPFCGDGRFGALGAGALAVAGFAGVDVAAALAGAADIVGTFSSGAFEDNPATSFAVGAILAERDLDLRVPVFLAGHRRLESFVNWAARAWSITLAETTQRGTVRARVGMPPCSGLVGDEELLELLLEGPRDTLVTTVQVGMGDVHDEAFAALWRDRPALRLRLHSLDPASVGAAVALVTRAAVVAAVYADREPVALASLERWRAAVAEAVDGARAAE